LTKEEEKELIALSTLAAIGGRKLVLDKKINLRYLVNRKFSTINNNINITLFSIIGHAIMPILAQFKYKFAIRFRETLGGDYLYGNCNLSKLSEKRKEALTNLKNKHPLTSDDINAIQTLVFKH